MTHSLRLVPGPAAFLDATRDALGNARRRAWVETYIVSDDAMGQTLADLLGGAAARGADARLLYDPAGSKDASDGYFADLERRGVKVRAFGHLPWLRLVRPGVRDHSRLVVADDRAFTGGHNWAGSWAPQPMGKGWHDLSVGVVGDVVEDMAAVYDRRWREARGGWIRDYDSRRRYEDVRFLADGPHGRRRITAAHVEAFEGARRRIWLAHAYYLPARSFRRALYAAADRGVDVRLLLPGPTDLPVVRHAARAEYRHWLERGLRIWEFAPVVMHAKYAVVDDDWAAVGSYNAVPSSATVTLEVALAIRRPEFVAQLAAQFEEDLADGCPVTLDELASRSFRTRALDGAARALLRGGGTLVRR